MTRPTADPRTLAAARATLDARGARVLHEDHLLLFVAKASGLLSQGGPTGEASLVDHVAAYRSAAEGKPGRAFVGLVHRLDRNVSGAMVVAKSSKAAARLSAAFRTRDAVEKTYVAWVAGEPPSESARLEGVLTRDAHRRTSRVAADPEVGDEADAGDGAGDPGSDGRDVALSYDVEARGRGVARLRVRLLTGATHQIRAQLAAAGLPILCDAKYGGPAAPAGARLRRVALHAHRLSVPHPVGGARVAVEAPLPDDLAALDAASFAAPRRA